MHIRDVVKEALGAGLFDKAGKLLPEHTGETQAKIAGAFMQSPLQWRELNAIALAVRAVGDLEGFEPDSALTSKQKTALASLASEKSLPADLRALIEAATPALSKRRDLYAFYGVLSGTLDHLIANANILKLDAADASR